MDKLSRTVLFTVDDWDSDRAMRYQVRFAWRRKNYVWDGTIRREPHGDELFKLGCFSCDNGYLFPIPAMVAQVKQQNPDMLFFAGDQIYESDGPQMVVAKESDSKSMQPERPPTKKPSG